jgi:hypothetical protein
MQIKLNSKSVLQIQGDTTTVNVEFRDGEFKGEIGTELLVSSQEKPGSISGPGEYEYNGAAVIGMETKGVHVGTMELAVVQTDGANVLCVLDTPGEISKDNWDFLGDVDVMVVDKSIEIAEVDKLVNKINPYVLIIINSNKEEAEKWVSTVVELEDKKFKFSERDFDGEDPVTRVFLLE